jgi:hypothetical protein
MLGRYTRHEDEKAELYSPLPFSVKELQTGAGHGGVFL